ncbi:mechanosensitive ion channel family protein [Teredinibacter waterburyi]|jgi:Small-conductance mechanosensitive channel|uniref:mechanosensitive ion channel family protein n=1 Tax=Teredinibacter waterburyi TaxID=1500538 RepID=UPI00165F1FD6|nr:mechanosensitive ion channel domain-containing protein [Teredinibacter waterburyi]
MSFSTLDDISSTVQSKIATVLAQQETYTQLIIIFVIYLLSWFLASRIRRHSLLKAAPTPDDPNTPPSQSLLRKFSTLIFPLLAISLLRISVDLTYIALKEGWLVKTALTVALLLLFNTVVKIFVRSPFLASVFRWVGIPILFLHMVGVLAGIIHILESISFSVGNISVSAFGVTRVAIFGSVLFWLGRVSNNTGQDIIRRQQQFDIRTREVMAKLFEIGLFILIFLLLLQIMGVNLTALAVFGGAVGVGLGFGLQSIAANFISGIIILLDRSISIGDYIELDDGRTGIVRQLNMRSTTLETFDGKDIMVPNEKFIGNTFTNWTHKNKKQRYRVDFSVAYHTNVRELVSLIKTVVSEHPQVMSGNNLPIEEQPDCEIDSFGDSGINMFVEFWMEGIDDGENRVGGDLMLMILEALQQNGYEIPFPQREVRVLNTEANIHNAKIT